MIPLTIVTFFLSINSFFSLYFSHIQVILLIFILKVNINFEFKKVASNLNDYDDYHIFDYDVVDVDVADVVDDDNIVILY